MHALSFTLLSCKRCQNVVLVLCISKFVSFVILEIVFFKIKLFIGPKKDEIVKKFAKFMLFLMKSHGPTVLNALFVSSLYCNDFYPLPDFISLFFFMCQWCIVYHGSVYVCDFVLTLGDCNVGVDGRIQLCVWLIGWRCMNWTEVHI